MHFLELVVPYLSVLSLVCLGAAAFTCFVFSKWVSKLWWISYLPLIGSFFAWAFSLFSFLKVPFFLPWLINEGDQFFDFTPTFTVHEFTLPLVQFLLTIQMVRSLALTLQKESLAPERWSEEIVLLLLSILACFSANPLTLIIIWIAIDGMQIWISLPFFHQEFKPLIISRFFILRWAASFGFLWLMALEQGSMVDLTLLEFSPTLRYGLLLFIIIRMYLTLREAQTNSSIFPTQPHLSYAAFVHIASYFAVLAQLAASGTFEISWVIPIILSSVTLGWIIYWRIFPQDHFIWMPLIFLAIALISTLQNDTYAVLVWGMTFILFAFFIEVFPSVYKQVEKWNLFPALLVALVLPFTPLWFNSPFAELLVGNTAPLPLALWATIALLFLIQANLLFIITRQIQYLSSASPFRTNPLKDIPSTVMSLSIWSIYFLLGIWLFFHTPLPPLWVSLPYACAFLFLFLGSKIARRLSYQHKEKIIASLTSMQHQFNWQISRRLEAFSFSNKLNLIIQRIISASSLLIQTSSEIIEGESGLLWGFIIFALLVSLLFQPAP